MLGARATLHAEEPRPISPVFASTLTKVEVQPGQTSVLAGWDFTNRADFPLAVESIEISCGCLAAQTGTQVVEPGKSGRIEATFLPGSYRGTLRKSIHVRFLDQPQPIELVMEAHIPSPVELSANELSWKPGQSSTQSINVKSGTGAPFAITGLLGVTGLFDIQQETLTEGTQYRLNITPTGNPGIGPHILQVRTDSKDPRDQVLVVFLKTAGPAKPATTPVQTATTR